MKMLLRILTRTKAMIRGGKAEQKRGFSSEKQQIAMMGCQQQKRVTGFCRVPARASLTARRKKQVTWSGI
jgi:hypothetical protein